MTLFAWSNYEKYAWGENELRPISRIGHSANIFGTRSTKLGATIVDGLDTMYLMGFMDEYKRGKEWIMANLDLNLVCYLFFKPKKDHGFNLIFFDF
jgi:mannosyl-oligosaccharide alpha-1,2-mannosidase